MSSEVTIVALFMLYKVICLAAGTAISYMGFRLFFVESTKVPGELEASTEKYKLMLRTTAPGTFFALFGAIVVCISILKTLSIEPAEQDSCKGVPVPQLIPDRIPDFKEAK